MIGGIKTIDCNDVNPNLLMLDNTGLATIANGAAGIKVENEFMQSSEVGKTYINLDGKHWQGGTTTVLEERTLPVVFEDNSMLQQFDDRSNSPPMTSTRKSRPGRRAGSAAAIAEEEAASPEERERLRIRRERNKEAAARCRKRKMDQIESLEKQVSELEAKKALIQRELCDTKKERDELQYMLSQHSTTCQLAPAAAQPPTEASSGYQLPAVAAVNHQSHQQAAILRVPNLQQQQQQATTSTRTSPHLPTEKVVVVKNEHVPHHQIPTTLTQQHGDESVYTIHQQTTATNEDTSLMLSAGGGFENEEAESLVMTAATTSNRTAPLVSSAPLTVKKATALNSRPARPMSLNFSTTDIKPQAQNLRSICGVPIETPTNVFSAVTFDALMDGRTGLTPTNVLTPVLITTSATGSGTLSTPIVSSPTCSSQHQRGAGAGAADKNLKLVSL